MGLAGKQVHVQDATDHPFRLKPPRIVLSPQIQTPQTLRARQPALDRRQQNTLQIVIKIVVLRVQAIKERKEAFPMLGKQLIDRLDKQPLVRGIRCGGADERKDSRANAFQSPLRLEAGVDIRHPPLRKPRPRWESGCRPESCSMLTENLHEARPTG